VVVILVIFVVVVVVTLIFVFSCCIDLKDYLQIPQNITGRIKAEDVEGSKRAESQ